MNKLEKVPNELSNLKRNLGKSNVDKLVPVPVDLCNLSDVVKNDVVKKTKYDEFAKKFKQYWDYGTSNLRKKAGYDTKSGGIKKKLDHNHDKYISM